MRYVSGLYLQLHEIYRIDVTAYQKLLGKWTKLDTG